MQRVMIVGQPGSGKSTLATKLGEVTGLPVVHIDKIHWKPGWQERSEYEKSAMCREVHAREHWIFEGGHSVTWPERLERCNALIWLDFPLGIRLWRVFLRTLRHYGKSRPDLPAGCPERFNFEFLWWIWSTRRSNRVRIHKLIKSASSEKSIWILRTDREIDACVRSFSTALRH